MPVALDRSQPIDIMRQVQIGAGSLVLVGVVLGTLVAPGFYALSGFVGAGLLFAGDDRLLRNGASAGPDALESAQACRGTMTILHDLLAVASGSVVGFVLGLVGGGGSILAVPLLVYVVGVPSPHVAIGTSAIAVAVSAAANLAGHARAQTVKWPCAITFAIAGMIGAAAWRPARKDGRWRPPSDRCSAC